MEKGDGKSAEHVLNNMGISWDSSPDPVKVNNFVSGGRTDNSNSSSQDGFFARGKRGDFKKVSDYVKWVVYE